MRFSELFEMPTFIPRELPTTDVKVHVASVDTLDRDYELLGNTQRHNQKIIAAIKKDRSQAIIGPAVQRSDGKPSMDVIVTIKFHEAPDLGEVAGHNAIQVDTVVSAEDIRGFGYGYMLYKMLLNRGYTVVSDNIQYIGGRKLWEKILRQSSKDNHNVFILQNGKYLRDANGAPLVYDGVNISADDIWSTDKRSEPHYYTLLVAKNI